MTSTVSHSLFGLPSTVQFCDSCTYSNQKPNSESEFRFKLGDSKSGLNFYGNTCSACHYNKTNKSIIDWEERHQLLSDLCDKHRSTDGSYDCIVPGSGGKDSFYAALTLKNVYNMNPLTVTWAPHIYTQWGWKNFQAWIDSGLPNYLYHPNGGTHRFLSRLALENIFHPFQPFIIGQYSFPLKCSLKFNIPLVFYGENSAEYGNSLDDNLSPNTKYHKIAMTDSDSDFFVAGISSQELSSRYGLSPESLSDYRPLEASLIQDNKIEWHYLGYYLKWHPQDNYYFSTRHGFTPAPERNSGSYSRYSSLDDKLDDFNFYCHYIKYGLGRATFDTSQEIRNNEITLEEAHHLLRRFDGEYPSRFESDLFEYWSVNKIPGANQKMYEAFPQPQVDRNYFTNLTNRFRSPHLWAYDNLNQEWSLKHASYH